MFRHNVCTHTHTMYKTYIVVCVFAGFIYSGSFGCVPSPRVYMLSVHSVCVCVRLCTTILCDVTGHLGAQGQKRGSAGVGLEPRTQ